MQCKCQINPKWHGGLVKNQPKKLKIPKHTNKGLLVGHRTPYGGPPTVPPTGVGEHRRGKASWWHRRAKHNVLGKSVLPRWPIGDATAGHVGACRRCPPWWHRRWPTGSLQWPTGGATAGAPLGKHQCWHLRCPPTVPLMVHPRCQCWCCFVC